MKNGNVACCCNGLLTAGNDQELVGGENIVSRGLRVDVLVRSGRLWKSGDEETGSSMNTTVSSGSAVRRVFMSVRGSSMLSSQRSQSSNEPRSSGSSTSSTLICFRL